MMDYGPYFVLSRIKKFAEQLASLMSSVGYILSWIRNFHPSSGSIIMRDAPSSPELAPSDPQGVTMLVFRSQDPSLFWDPVAQAWITET